MVNQCYKKQAITAESYINNSDIYNKIGYVYFFNNYTFVKFTITIILT